MKPNNYLPLIVWKVTILFSVIIVGLLALPNILDSNDPTEAWIRHRLSPFLKNVEVLVNSERGINEEGRRVVVFGSSRTQAGVEKSEYFEECFNEAGLQVTFFRTFLRGCSNEVLWTPAFFDAIEQLNPDLVCIEDQVFTFQPRSKLKLYYPSWIRNYSYNVDLFRRNLLRRFEFTPRQETNKQDFEEFIKYDSQTALVDTVNFSLPQREVRSYEDNELLNRTLESWTANGIQVVVYKVPRPGPIDSNLFNAKQETAYSELMTTYKERFGLDFWEPDFTLPFSFYFDDLHMNINGRALYSDWLCGRMNHQIQENID